MEGSPGTKVNLARELSSGRGVIVGVPAAYSNNALPFHLLTDTYNQGPACSGSHIPGYVNSPKLKNAGKVFVVSVNDPFVYVLNLSRLL